MIVNSNVQSLASLYTVSSSSGVRRGGGRVEQPAAQDRISLSSEAKSFSSALRGLRESGEVRPDKVAAYAAQVASGSYRVDASDIAGKLLQARF